MEPMLPPVGQQELEDRAFDLVQKASTLGGRVPASVKSGIGELVRSMNCYYSNLIEGHYTHPHDIDRALKNDYSTDPEKRELQKEAVAHIHVQRMIDEGHDPKVAVTSIEYVTWIHRKCYALLPEELLWVKDPDTGERLPGEPGRRRETTVAVGRHIPPRPEYLLACLHRFAEAYEPVGMSRLQQVIAVAAAHHRLTWIVPKTFFGTFGRIGHRRSGCRAGSLQQNGVASSGPL